MRYGKFQMSPSIQEWTEAVVQGCSIKKLFLEISQNSKESTCARVSFLIKLQAEAYNFIKKETLAQVFSCEFCEISKNTFFYRTPPVAASQWRRKQGIPSKDCFPQILFGLLLNTLSQIKPMPKLLPLDFIFNNGGEIKDVGKMKILFQSLRELSECLFL